MSLLNMCKLSTLHAAKFAVIIELVSHLSLIHSFSAAVGISLSTQDTVQGSDKQIFLAEISWTPPYILWGIPVFNEWS